jgi:branched-chain amino acid transport system substrate-binding protein
MEMSMLPGKIGGYEIINKIGEGGMAIVYQARDPRLNREVAIKVIKPNFGDITVFQQRFKREAQALAKLGDNPHILSVHNYSEYIEENETEGARAFLVTDYLPGGSLAQKLQGQPRLSVQDALRISMQLLDALTYAHSRGVIHRDVAPGNILFRADGSLVLSDFGLVTILEEKPEDSPTSLTQEQQVPGTPMYIAPERFTQRNAIPQNDLYSVGVVLYRMLAGKQYYELLGDQRLLDNQPQGISKANQMVPPKLEQIMLKAVAREPEQRYASASAFKADLNVAQRELIGSTIPTTPPIPDFAQDPYPGSSAQPNSPDPTHQLVGQQQTIQNTMPAHQLVGQQQTIQNTMPVNGNSPRTPFGSNPIPSPPERHAGKRVPFWYFFVILVLVVLLILTGYDLYLTRAQGTSGSPPIVPATAPSSSTIQIAIDAPLSGIDSSDGGPIWEGAEDAIQQANQLGTIPHYTLVGVREDDTGSAGTADPSKGAMNMVAAINNGLTAAIIGPYNSSVAVAEMPLTNQAQIAQLSPANTDPCLTKETPAEFCAGDNDLIPTVRPTGEVNYFRLVATDDAQATIFAQFLRKKGYRSAYIIYSEGDNYSDTLAGLFREAWQNDQGTLVAPMDNEPADAPIDQYASQLQQLTTIPDLIFFAGTMPAAARVKEAMDELPELKATAYAGGAGLDIDSFVQSITHAGTTGGPIYTAVPVIDDAQTNQFETNYNNSSPTFSYRPYTATANDCALITIQAIKMAIESGTLPAKNPQDIQEAKKFREAVIQKIARMTVHDIPATNNLFIATSFQSFNANGDNTNNFVSIYSFNANTPSSTPWQLQESVSANS